jgi:hypothetical protein
MATVEFIGTRITDAESTTNWGSTNLGGGGGAWSAPALDTDQFKQGVNSVVWTHANTALKQHFCWYNVTTGFGRNLNFGPGGTDEGRLIYIWAQHALAMTSSGLTATQPGLAVGLSSNGTASTNLAWWTFYGVENYPGGWVRLVIDPRTVPSASGASFNLSDVDYVGVVATSTVAKTVPVLRIDAIDLGSGIRYHGSGTIDSFSELIQKDQDTVANRWGVIESLEDTDSVIKIRGILEIGSGNNVATNFSSSDKVVVFEAPKYITTNSTKNNALQDSYPRITIRRGGTQNTNVTVGTKVGTGDDASGRNGVIFLANNEYRYSFNIESGVNSVKLYGTTIKNFNNNLAFSGNANFELAGCSFDNNGQFQPQKDAVIRDVSFLNVSGSQGALLWTSGLDIKNCRFINNVSLNGSGVAIEHEQSLNVVYDGLIFSNNNYDVFFSPVSSGNLVISATNGSNPVLNKVLRGNANSFVDIVNTVTLTLTGLVLDSEVRIYEAGTLIELDGTDSSSSSFIFSFQGGDPNVDIRIFHLDYQPVNLLNFVLPTSNTSVPIQQIFDRNYTNP